LAVVVKRFPEAADMPRRHSPLYRDIGPEEEKHWADSLREYRMAKNLAANVEGPMYRDLRGGVYEIAGVREEVDRSIERVAKLNESARQQP
jgi:hypothetical protein